MTFFQNFEVGLLNGWMFIIPYGIMNLVLFLIYPKTFKKRVFEFPKYKHPGGKILSAVNMIIFLRGTFVLAFFLPIKYNALYFWPGVFLYCTCLVILTLSMVIFAKTDRSTPVTRGVYRISRNPMQVITAFMWIGAGIALQSWIMIIFCFIHLALSYPSFLAQERFCLGQYGEQYKDYMDCTPRYLLFI